MNMLPDADDSIVDSAGVLSDQARSYLLQLGKIIAGDEPIKYKRYASLAAIQAAIPNPANDKVYGIVTGQGLALYNGLNWVLAADDTTLIT